MDININIERVAKMNEHVPGTQNSNVIILEDTFKSQERWGDKDDVMNGKTMMASYPICVQFMTTSKSGPSKSNLLYSERYGYSIIPNTNA